MGSLRWNAGLYYPGMQYQARCALQFNLHGPAIYYVQLGTVGSKQLQLGLLANGSYTTFPLPGPYNAG